MLSKPSAALLKPKADLLSSLNSALIASAFAIISCCSKIFTDKT